MNGAPPAAHRSRSRRSLQGSASRCECSPSSSQREGPAHPTGRFGRPQPELGAVADEPHVVARGELRRPARGDVRCDARLWPAADRPVRPAPVASCRFADRARPVRQRNPAHRRGRTVPAQSRDPPRRSESPLVYGCSLPARCSSWTRPVRARSPLAPRTRSAVTARTWPDGGHVLSDRPGGTQTGCCTHPR